MTWQHYARCIEIDPELFYAETTGEIRNAKAFCETCPVIEQCLDAALYFEATLTRQDIFGVRGGKSASQRKELIRKQGLNVKVCRICNNRFKPANNYQGTCSAECKLEGQRRSARHYKASNQISSLRLTDRPSKKVAA